MEFKNKEIKKNEILKAIICIALGTGTGLLTYILFLHFNIAIFGWNLGLIFAPLVAGYVETIFAVKLLGENIGAISAFILFIDTVIYGFILKNPTLGFNLITAGSIVIILQSAFPTLVNYIILVVIGGIISRFIKRIKIKSRQLIILIKKHQPFHWDGPNVELESEIIPSFNEEESNKKINNLGFYFITSTDMNDKNHELIGIYHSEVIIEKDKNIIPTDPEKSEKLHLNRIKENKDECLINLAKQIQNDGGNGILDLTMNYSLIGNGRDNIQITAMGIGIHMD